MTDNLYRKLSEERKQLQKEGKLPEWYTTGGWQLFKSRYAVAGEEAFYGRAKTIATTLSKHLPVSLQEEYEGKFFDLLWKGWLSPSTPVLSNTGTNKGMPVSCSGVYVDDSIDGFYSSLHENAVLTKNGFGTSAYIGDIRPRGSPVSAGGKASGVMPVIKEMIQMSRNVNQGNRRGAIAYYIPIEHGDFDEVIEFLKSDPDDNNVGWVISNAFIDKLKHDDKEALRRFRKVLYVKMVTGRGYFWFNDKANALSPLWYKEKGLSVKASNLC